MKTVMVGSKMFIKLLKMWVNMLSTSIQQRFCKTYWERNDFWIDVGRQNVPPKETAKATKHRSKFVFLCDAPPKESRDIILAGFQILLVCCWKVLVDDFA